MEPEKVKAIQGWNSPKNIFEVRRFHGLSIFYRKFIRNFSKISAPIIETIKKDKQPFQWTTEAETRFQLLKKRVTEQPILVLPYFQKPFQVKCDANGEVIGPVLSQDHKPIAYFSENMNESRKKYSSYDKEFYVVVQSLKKWRHYLLPKEFVLYSENHGLQYIMQQPKLNERHVKWVEYLQNFTFVKTHISGKFNKIADALSRRALVMQGNQVHVIMFDSMKDLYVDDADFKDAFELVNI